MNEDRPSHLGLDPESARGERRTEIPKCVLEQVLDLLKLLAHLSTGSFADSHLTDALKTLGTDPSTDPKVKKKLISVLASWHAQFKDDPSMSTVANLYRQVRPNDQSRMRVDVQALHSTALESDDYWERKRQEEKERKEKKEEEKRKAKEAKEAEKIRQRLAEEERRKNKNKPKRRPFNFEQVDFHPRDAFPVSIMLIIGCRRGHRF